MVSPEVIRTLRALEERLLDPTVRGSPQEAGALLDNEFSEIGQSGRLYGKAEMLEALRAFPGFNGPRSIQDLEAKALSGDVVLLIYRVLETGTRRSSIWRRADGQWRLVFHQGTPAPISEQY